MTASRRRLDAAPVADEQAMIRGENYRITVLFDGLVRLEYSADGDFEDRASTFAVHRAQPVPEFDVIDGSERLEVVTSRLRVVYDKKPFSASGLSVAVRAGTDGVWRYGVDAENLGGTARTLDDADGRVELDDGIQARRGFAAIDDSDTMLFTEDGWVGARTPGRLDVYVFAYGHDHVEALQAFYAVSGQPPVLPRWALGNWWSRFHPYTADGYREIIERFRAEGIPLSVGVIDMDWHLRDIDPQHGTGWTGYSWNRDLIPDPPALLTWLHEQGVRVSLNVHPAEGVGAHEDAYPALAKVLRKEADGEPIPFDVTDRAFIDAYFDVLHRDLESDGVDFWWIDWQQGAHSRVEGVTPLWMLNHLHFLDNAREGRRGLQFSRYAGPGNHRYPVGFSGDSVISWDTLAFQPEFTATAANIGYGWWSHDIGGFFKGERDDELAVRWIQFGTFSPILRLHAGENPFIRKEPWMLPPEARQIATHFLRLRHRLVPYLHTMNHRAASGLPLVQPLYYAWPDSPEAYEHPNQYLFGDQLIIAPITSPHDDDSGLGAVRTWLPEGTWVDVLADIVYDGDREIVLHRDLDSMPVLARPGAIVPLDGALGVDGDPLANDPVAPAHMDLLVVPGADGAFTIVEDDGAAQGATARVQVTFDHATGRLRVAPPTGDAEIVPAARDWTVTFVATDPAMRVRAHVDGVEAEVTRESAPGASRVRVTVRSVPRDAVLVVEGAGSAVLRGVDADALVFERLSRAPVAHGLKARVWKAVSDGASAAQIATTLDAWAIPSGLTSALHEALFARS